MTDDESLRERFAVLFRERYPELCHFVLQFVRSRSVAEELVQDLFLRIWERRQSWEEELPSRSYLYQAARNRALDHLKHERIAERASAHQPDDDDPRPYPESRTRAVRSPADRLVEAPAHGSRRQPGSPSSGATYPPLAVYHGSCEDDGRC